MRQVIDHVEALKSDFAELTYFRILGGEGTRSDIEIMAPGLTFFILNFQDVLRLNAELVTDPLLAGIAREQRKDDLGHDHWFLSDLAILGLEPDVRWLFGRQHQRTRDTAYEITAEMLAATHDASRIAVALALEATGAVYFSRVHHFFEKLGASEGLQFFAASHWEVEQSHAMFDDEHEALLAAYPLTPAQREAAQQAATNVFTAVSRMCIQLSRRMVQAREDAGFTQPIPAPSRLADGNHFVRLEQEAFAAP